ncbi:hypothetical protein [Mesorhizobium sp. M0047]|uniref:hypothetical protein n=1 Tax=Mesorhizobium sp. M0047 TaxID=2956859 RepID=UPI003339E02F
MRGSTPTRFRWLALRATSALALAVAPYQLAFHGSAPGPIAAAAHAKDSGHDGGAGGSGGSGSGNSGNSGSGGGDDGASNDHGTTDNSGTGKSQNDGGAGHHVNAATGDKVDVDRNKIEVQHPDGTTEEIANGRFEMKDALGRTIVERAATARDYSRLQAL